MKTDFVATYHEAKERHPGMILLFRMGDFYEMFGEDAETCAKVCDLTLTSRNLAGSTVAMAGFPHHALEPYLRKLLNSGKRVAVCDQVDPMAPVVGAQVNRVVLPASPAQLPEKPSMMPQAERGESEATTDTPVFTPYMVCLPRGGKPVAGKVVKEDTARSVAVVMLGDNYQTSYDYPLAFARCARVESEAIP
jgi:hypothetical protein